MRGIKVPKIIKSVHDGSIILSNQQPKYSLIWLHGLGGEAVNFVSFFTHSDSPLYHGGRIKLIQAPKRWVSLAKTHTPSWYDLYSTKRFTDPQESVFNFQQIDDSCSIVDRYVQEQIQFWKQNESLGTLSPQKRIYVGGVSQGGVVSLYYSLSSKQTLAGTISLSGYLLKSAKLHNFGKLPIFLIHGQRDTVIQQTQARTSYDKLLANSVLTDYKTIKKLQHNVCLQQIDMIKTWMVGSHQFHCSSAFSE